MDLRIQRTRTALQTALLALCRERPLDAITVGEICERAGVNRSSFYKHYPDKETLAADSIEAEIDELAGALLSDPSLDIAADAPRLLTAYLQHVADNAHVYRALFAERATGVLSNRLRRNLERRINAMIPADQPADPAGLPIDIMAAGVASATFGIIGAWITQRDPAPVETAAGWVWALLAPLQFTAVAR